MNAEVFIDTNVLLYTIDEDPASAVKRERARQLLLTERWAWSVQVAAEFYVNSTSQKRPFRLASADALALLEAWFAYLILQHTPELIHAAIAVQQRYQLNYWDAAILAAAKAMGTHSVYSEGLNSGQDYDGVKVANPFAD
jgi:predicted nucleic acid-binding protein